VLTIPLNSSIFMCSSCPAASSNIYIAITRSNATNDPMKTRIAATPIAMLKDLLNSTCPRLNGGDRQGNTNHNQRCSTPRGDVGRRQCNIMDRGRARREHSEARNHESETHQRQAGSDPCKKGSLSGEVHARIIRERLGVWRVHCVNRYSD
jgi:hypothetical protein